MAWYSKNSTKWHGEREGATWNSLIFSWNSLFATWNSLTAAGEWFAKLETEWFSKKYSSG